ncbi:MAG: DUF4160 domain-containing protein [Pseudomonadota bacterium]
MLESVVKAKYIDGYKVWISFDDGKSGEIDLKNKIKTLSRNYGSVFKPLQDINYFKNFKVLNDTLSWKNEADIAPERLYELLIKQNKLTRTPKEKLSSPKKFEISRFLGIKILMLYSKNTEPHFVAKYGKYEVSIEIKAETLSGNFPARALDFVFEWLDLNKKELLENWKLGAKDQPLKKIKPLE